MALFPRQNSVAAGCALAAVLAFAADPGVAAATEAAPAHAIDLDLQSLKDQAIALNRDIQGAEQRLLYPDQSRASFYVAVKVPGFLLDEISIRINENEPATHSYTDSEARAFLKGDGLHRLLRMRLEPGSYRLQGSYIGHFYDAKATEPPVKGTVETVFEKGLTELDMVLPISRNSRLDRPGLSEVSRLESRKVRPNRNIWLPGPLPYEPQKADRGVLDDPRYRFATFLKEDGRYLTALTELLELEQGVADPAALPGEFRLTLAECYLDFGMDAQAQQRYEQITAGPHDAATLARAQLQLARLEYQRGYFAKALARMTTVREALPDDLRDEGLLVQTSTLLALERYQEVDDLLAPKADDLGPVLRYNRAVALMHQGKPDEARQQLNIIGAMDATDVQTLMLRDKANLALGYQYLQAQQGNDARTVFSRIRATGPFSNRALLGLGWAEVAYARKKELADEAAGKSTDDSIGTMLRPGYVDPKAGSRAPKNAAPVRGLSPEEQQALLRALVPWVELSKRDPMDPAVQEGLLAIPWALDRLQDYGQSLTRYQDAIAALENARKRMDEAMRSIKGGRMVETIVRRDIDSEKGWMWRLRDLPDAPETYFLQALLAEHRFQESIKNYRDARLLSRSLDAWAVRLDTLERTAGGGSERQLQRARKGWHPAWTGTVVWLNLETSLGAPGAYDAPLSDAHAAPFELQTLEAPATFEGRREQLKPLRDRLEALRPRSGAAGNAEDDLLEKISIHELEGQKKTIERYLTEARFAVARIYDRQLKGGQ